MIKIKDVKVFPGVILFVLAFRMVGRSMKKSVASKQNLKGMQTGSKAYCLPCEHWSRHLGKRNLGGKKRNILKPLMSELSLIISHKNVNVTDIQDDLLSGASGREYWALRRAMVMQEVFRALNQSSLSHDPHRSPYLAHFWLNVEKGIQGHGQSRL